MMDKHDQDVYDEYISNTIKTVDELVQSYLDEPGVDSYSNTKEFMTLILNHVLIKMYETLINALKNKDNKPSKYDLHIVNYIKTLTDTRYNFPLDQQPHLIEILDLYRNRKN